MSISVTKMAQELKDATAWQATPEALDDEQYIDMIVRGIKKFYIDINRASEYSDSKLIWDEETEQELLYDADLQVNEQYYVMLCAKLEFLKKVQSDVNNIVGYTTNALTVTNADKPYANLKDSISQLDNERRIVYYKMVDYTM